LGSATDDREGNSMKISLVLVPCVIAALVAGCFGGGVDGYAYEVETPGSGRYEKITTNVGVVISDGSIEAKIPARVAEGDQISVVYVADGREVTDALRVRRISTKEVSGGFLCRLHAAPERTVGDTVYVKPCKVVR
jgi:hypothetical protein